MKKLTYIILGILLLLAALSTRCTYASCRSEAVKHAFDVQNHFPMGRKGYVVDHICSLYNGGLDTISNMQYQTIAEGKLKDKIENTITGRKIFCNKQNSYPYRTVYNCK